VSSNGESLVQFTGGELGELGRFLQQLHGSIDMRARWLGADRNGFIDTLPLTEGTRTFLKSNPDPTQVRARLVAEAGPGSQVWICVWIR
jgi:hypothetical protein